MLKVLKTNGTGRYYTSFIGDKQHVYCFKIKEDAEMCRNFILDYKKRHSMFPRINCGLFSKKVIKDPIEDTDILIEDAGPDFESTCLLNKVGLVELKYFNYTYTNSSYSINLATSRLISNDEFEYSIPVLNNLLLREDPPTPEL